MASYSPDFRRSTGRRDSSRSDSNGRRPRLLRASATEPSITTSNASRGAMVSPQPSRRATELLAQVAYISGSPPQSVYRSSSASAARSPVLEADDVFGTSPSSQGESLDEYQPRKSCLVSVHVFALGSRKSC